MMLGPENTDESQPELTLDDIQKLGIVVTIFDPDRESAMRMVRDYLAYSNEKDEIFAINAMRGRLSIVFRSMDQKMVIRDKNGQWWRIGGCTFGKA